MADLGQRPLALTIERRWRQRHALGYGGTCARGQESAQVAGESEVLLRLLFLDDLLGGAAKRQLVTFTVGPK